MNNLVRSKRTWSFCTAALVLCASGPSLSAQSFSYVKSSITLTHCQATTDSLIITGPANVPCTLTVDLARYVPTPPALPVLFGVYTGGLVLLPNGVPQPTVTSPPEEPGHVVFTWSAAFTEPVTVKFQVEAARSYVIDDTSPLTLHNEYHLSAGGSTADASTEAHVVGPWFTIPASLDSISTGTTTITRTINITRFQNGPMPGAVWLVDEHPSELGQPPPCSALQWRGHRSRRRLFYCHAFVVPHN